MTTQPPALHDDLPVPSTVLLRRPSVVVAVVGAAVALGVLVAINPSWLAGVDKPTSKWARALGAHDFFATATEIGSTYLWIPLVLVFAAALWRRCPSFAFTLPVVLASAMVVDFALKLIVDRPRPPGTLVSTGLSSYPSGHVIVAVAMLGLLPPVTWILSNHRWLFRVAVGTMFAGVAVVAFSRVNLGAHWPSDVAASFVIGAALLLLAEFLARRTWRAAPNHTCRMHPGEGPVS